ARAVERGVQSFAVVRRGPRRRDDCARARCVPGQRAARAGRAGARARERVVPARVSARSGSGGGSDGVARRPPGRGRCRALGSNEVAWQRESGSRRACFRTGSTSTRFGVVTMTITLNGKAHEVNERSTLAELLSQLGHSNGFAVARNREFVPRVEYARTTLEPGDDVEVLSPQQGG